MSGTISIDSPHNVLINMEAAPLGDRILAFVIDLLMILVYILCSYVIGQWLHRAGLRITIPLICIFSIPVVFYNLLFEIFMNGQSPGKRIMKLQVTSISGHKLTAGGYILRWLFRLIDIYSAYGLIALLSIVINDKNQRLGDIVAGTSVISLKQRTKLKETVFQKLSKDYSVSYYGVTNLSEKDVYTIAQILNSRLSTMNPATIERLAHKVAGIIQIQKPSSSRNFLQTVLKDYNQIMREID